MEEKVQDLVTFIRHNDELSSQILAKKEGSCSTSTKDNKCFVTIPISHSKSPSTKGSDSPKYHAMLIRLCRRYGNDIVVKGTFLNPEEIQVHALQLVGRFRNMEMNPEGTYISLSGDERFILLCEDEDSIRKSGISRVLRIDPRNHNNTSKRIRLTCKNCKEYEKLEIYWKQPIALKTLTNLYGFDLSDQSNLIECNRISEDEDIELDSVNSFIYRDLTFGDLRGVNKMMDFYSIQGRLSLLKDVQDVSESNNYIALGTKQKTLWSQERYDYGQELLSKGKHRDAIAEFSNALKLDEENLSALMARGDTLIRGKMYAEAIEDFKKVLNLKPDHLHAKDLLMSAESKLSYSRHVSLPKTTSSSHQNSRDGQLSRDPSSFAIAHPASQGHDDGAKPTSALEKDRLRQLLENEEHDRRRRRKRDGSGDEDERNDRKEMRKAKKSDHHKKTSKKKKRKKHDKKKSSSKKKSKKRRRYSDSEYSSVSSSSCDDEMYSSSNSNPKRKDRSTSHRGSSKAGTERSQQEEHVHPILSRQQHRIWR